MINNVRMVKLQSTRTNTLNVYAPEYNINKTFPHKGAVQMIPFDTLQNLLWDNGFRAMIDSGDLYIDSMEDKIDLGLEEPETTEPTNIKVFSDAQIKTLLTSVTYDTFVKEIDSVSASQVNNVVEYAIKNEIVDIQKCDYLKKKTGRDIINLIAKRRQEAELDRLEAEKAKADKPAEGEFRRV